MVGRAASRGPESPSGKSAGWDGAEVLRKKADFSGSFLVAGETGGDQEQLGNKTVWPQAGCSRGWGGRHGLQGRRGRRGFQPPHLLQPRRGAAPRRAAGWGVLHCVCLGVRETDGRVFVCVARLSLCISQKQTPPGTVLVSPLPASFSHVSPCPPEAPILQSTVIVLLGPASHQGPADPSETRWAPLWSGIAFEAAPLALPRGQPGGASSHPFLRDVSRRDVGLMA